MAFHPPKRRPTFTHEPLRLGGNSIRLVTLQPDQHEDSQIRCHIEQYASHRRPGYVALSYMWGAEQPQHQILLNGKEFRVRQNLYDCLQELRKQHDTPVALWIDAICIDQNDIAERNHVVQLMDQVYERSDRVYVWLGPSRDNSDEAIEFLLEVDDYMAPRGDSIDAFLERFLFPIDHFQDWVEVIRLFKREYWSRLWIIQETLLAPSLELFCGGQRIRWEQLEQTVLMLKRSFSSLVKEHPERSKLQKDLLDTLAARMMLRRRATAQVRGRSAEYPSLQYLLENFKDSVCTDLRDEIFGLLSIAGDFFDRRVDYIDYNLRSSEVFVRFLTHYLELTNDPENDETLYNVRRLGDALGLNGFKIIRHRVDSPLAKVHYEDLAIDTDDLCLALPCKVEFVLTDESEESDSATPTCVLRNYYGSRMSGIVPAAIAPGPSVNTMTLPNSPEELNKLRRLERSVHAAQVCDAFVIDCHASPSQEVREPTFKYFTRPIDKSKTYFRPTFGLACLKSQPGDLLVRPLESSLIFVARQFGEDVYDVIGTALIHEDSGKMYRMKSSFSRWWSSRSSITALPSPPITTVSTRDEPQLMVRFNPLMLLMIVNEPNWRKDRTNDEYRTPQRQPMYFTEIQPRGEDDPVQKEYGTRLFTGSAHFDKAANKVRDRALMKLEEAKDLIHQYEYQYGGKILTESSSTTTTTTTGTGSGSATKRFSNVGGTAG